MDHEREPWFHQLTSLFPAALTVYISNQSEKSMARFYEGNYLPVFHYSKNGTSVEEIEIGFLASFVERRY